MLFATLLVSIGSFANANAVIVPAHVPGGDPLPSLPTAATTPSERPAVPAGIWWADYDGDGLNDVYAITLSGTGHLLRNAGDGTFQDVTAVTGLGTIASPSLALWHDYDKDGDADLYLGSCGLMLNNGDGTFQDVAAQVGIAHAGVDMGAEWVDYDRDGHADLFVRTDGGDRVYHAAGNGTFEFVDLGLSNAVANAPAPTGAAENADEAATSARGAGNSPAKRPAPSVRNVLSTGETVPVSTGNVPPPESGSSPGNGSVGPFGFALPICADMVVDQTSLACINADSTPTIGTLYPLSTSFNLDPASNNVRLGTVAANPNFRLTAVGGSAAGQAAARGSGFDSTPGYLGVQGSTDFDGVTSADWPAFELGAVGISLSATPGDNYGVMGHSNGVGVRGENSASPTVDFGELGLAGIGLRASGATAAAEFEGPTQWRNALDTLNTLKIDNDNAGAALVDFSTDAGALSLRIDGDGGTGAVITGLNDAGLTTVTVDTDSGGGGLLQIEAADSTATMVVDGDGGDGGGVLTMRAADGSNSVVLDGEGPNSGGLVEVRRAAGTNTIVLTGDTIDNEGLVAVIGKVNITPAVSPAPFLDLTSASSAGPYFNITSAAAAGTSIGQIASLERVNTVPTANDILQMLAGASSSATFQWVECTRGADDEFRVDGDGDVFSDGAYTGPADFAEMIRVSTGAISVQPGDVVVIDPTTPTSVRKSQSRRSTLVAGIYSTNPGFVGSEREWDEDDPLDPNGERKPLKRRDMAKLYGEVPVAVVGIVPCKVTAEGGPIQPGDLLVTSSTPGHAMRDLDPKVGTVLGKALEPLLGSSGTIRVLVTLQ